MNEKFIMYREKYSKIIYKKYEVIDDEEKFIINYLYEIPGLITFNPSISFSKKIILNDNINQNLLDSIIFRLGLVELISYYKCVCPKTIEIEAGFIDKEEEKWFKKLFFNGLGEFLYTNNINIREEELFEFLVKGKKIEVNDIDYHGVGNLIPIGGGKDSIVTLELLKDYDNKCFMINSKKVQYDCASDLESYTIDRKIDKKIIELNKEGYLNGHIPISAVIAFISYLVAYLTNRKYIVLSNEGSANEPTVIGTNINHQYSKTYEFEKDFYDYTKKYFKVDIKYFSLLRPIKEIQIAYLFSKYKKYHKIFRSCNVGSKENPWVWCLNCPKCLFVYIMLRAFLPREEVIGIFGKNMLDNKELENYFLELIGKSSTKPFECIGTIEEVKYAMNRIVKDDDSYLSRLYKEKYCEEINIDLTNIYYENNVPGEYLEILKKAIDSKNMIIEKLKNYHNIAILGFGREGKSTYNYIRKYDKNIKLTILDEKQFDFDDENSFYKKYFGEDSLKEFDLIIKSPGIVIKDFSKETINKMFSQMELLLEFNRKNVIGITGTKGKSTTTSLIYNIFKDQLSNVFLVGNIGIPVLDEIDKFDDKTIIVAEMSSHQLETIDYSPHVGIILNMFIDHLDHAGSIENYHQAKMNIIRYQDTDDYAIYDIDNKYLKEQDFSNIKSNLLGVSLNDKTNIYMDDNGDIYINGELFLNKDKIVTELKGEHNLKNIMFALLVANIYHLDLNKALETIKNFKPLEHRMEYVGKYKDIIFYNDSIATIPEATINACKTLNNVDTLIFGGMDRNIDYKELIDYLNDSNISNFICMPTTGHKLAPFLDEKRVIKVDTLEEAVNKAFQVTKKDKICLLSPAAASYEYFKNFEEKGNKYKELIRNN